MRKTTIGFALFSAVLFAGDFISAENQSKKNAVAAKFAEEIVGYFNVGKPEMILEKFDNSQLSKNSSQNTKADQAFFRSLKDFKVTHWTFGPWELPPSMEDSIIAGSPNYLLLIVMQNPAKPDFKFRLKCPIKIDGMKASLIPVCPKTETSAQEPNSTQDSLPPLNKELSTIKGISFRRVEERDTKGVFLETNGPLKAQSAYLNDIVVSLVNWGNLIPNEEYIFDGLDKFPGGFYDVTVSPEILNKGGSGYKLVLDTILRAVKMQYKIKKTDVPIYYLRTIKGEESRLPKASTSTGSYFATGGIGMKFVGRTMSNLADAIVADRLVYDDTSLTGKYDFELPAENEWELKYWLPSIGLKLEPSIKNIMCVKFLPAK